MNPDAIKDGGPAFPVPGLQNDEDFNGMSLRDHFAGLAMQGDVASMPTHQDPAALAEIIASRAYMVADAMLKARQQ